MQRRAFIHNGLLTAFAVGGGFSPTYLRALSLPRPAKRHTLVCIFQRGAMDGLSAVQPLEDPHLEKLRPDLYLSAGSGRDQLSDLDGRFGLHPSLSSLDRLFREGQMSILHGVGLPTPTRSHFDAQDYTESGTPGRKSTPDGWLNRAAARLPGEGTPLRAVSMTAALPRALYGEQYAVAVERLEDLDVQRGRSDSTNNGFEALYRQTSAELLRDAGSTGLDAAALVSAAELERYRPARGVSYPDTMLGRGLRQIAQLIKSDVGLEIAFAESPNWDTHTRQGGNFGLFNRQARDLAASITAFWRDLGAQRDNVTLMTTTEFGRTVAQNGSGGTDHGRGSCAFVLDTNLAGSQVQGLVPELAVENLEDGRDLPVTTAFRAYYAGVLRHRLGIETTVFPGWEGEGLKF